MPPKRFQPKGANKAKSPNLIQNSRKLINVFHEEEADEKQYKDWQWYWDSSQYYGSQYQTIVDIPLLENKLIEPVMIFSKQELTQLPKEFKAYSPLFKEDDAHYLGVYGQLTHKEQNLKIDKVNQPLQFPYSCIGIITFIYKQLHFFCTGTIVGDNLILTAASSCYSTIRQDEHLYVSFTPSFQGNRGQTFKAKNIYFPSEFKDLGNPDRLLYNFCFIEIVTDINLPKYYGCLPLRLQNEDRTREKNYVKSAKICGYVLGQSSIPEMVEVKISITDNYDVIRYELCDGSWEGLNGSPILSEDLQIIGVHIYTAEPNSASSCGLSTLSWLMYDFIELILKRALRILTSSLKNFSLKQTQLISKLYLADNYYQRQNETNSKLEKICNQFNRRDWQNLKTLYIQDIFDAQNCKLLAKANFDNLAKLKLNRNRIGDEGCRWLAEGNWNLIELHLAENQIKNQGIDWLISAGWKNLSEFRFEGNILEGEHQKWVSKSQWPKLTLLSMSISSENDFYHNNWQHISKLYIQGGNCVLERWDKWLLHKNWKQLSIIELQHSNMGNKGCTWIHQGHFSLKVLNLNCNNISDEGAKWLSKSNWKQITCVQLSFNNLTNQSCKHLAKAKWPQLQYLRYKLVYSDLHKNLLERLGLKYLWKASFTKNLNSKIISRDRDYRSYMEMFRF